MTWVKTWKYKCTECDKIRATRFELLAQAGVCQKCRLKPLFDKSQLSIFDALSELNIHEPMEQTEETLAEIDLLIWDLETDGFQAPKNKILEIGAYIVRNGEVEQKRWVLNNDIEIPEHITAINGMTKEIIDAEGRDPVECLKEFLPLFKVAKQNVTHNGIGFDIPFLTNYAADLMGYTDDQKIAIQKLIRQTAYDTAVHFKAKKMGYVQSEDESFLIFASRVMGIRAYGVKFNLTLCAEESGIDLTEIVAHRALGDVEVTHQLYQKIHG